MTDSVCLVIPCYNEEHRLRVAGFQDYLANRDAAYLLFVDDGSTDETKRVLENICQGYAGTASILSLPRNGGKAEAVRLGILHGLNVLKASVVGYWDADLATPLDAVSRFRDVLLTRPDIEMVFGSRVQLLGRYVHRSSLRHYLGRIFATAASVVLRLPVYDTQCGAKLFRVEPHTQELFAKPFISRWVFDVEILARYIQLFAHENKNVANAIYEYPLEFWADVAGSKVRPGDFFLAFRDILRIYRTYMRPARNAR